MREDLRRFLIRQFGCFEGKDFDSLPQAPEAILTFFSWVVPAVVFVYWSNAFYPTSEVYSQTIMEAFSPSLWNTLVCIGIFSFGMAISFSTLPIFPRIANRVLHNAFSMGCLVWGVLVGQMVLLPFNEINWGWRFTYGLSFAALLGVLLFCNIFVWYLGSLVRSESDGLSRFLVKVNMMTAEWRLLIGASISGTSFVIFIFYA